MLISKGALLELLIRSKNYNYDEKQDLAAWLQMRITQHQQKDHNISIVEMLGFLREFDQTIPRNLPEKILTGKKR